MQLDAIRDMGELVSGGLSAAEVFVSVGRRTEPAMASGSRRAHAPRATVFNSGGRPDQRLVTEFRVVRSPMVDSHNGKSVSCEMGSEAEVEMVGSELTCYEEECMQRNVLWRAKPAFGHCFKRNR